MEQPVPQPQRQESKEPGQHRQGQGGNREPATPHAPKERNVILVGKKDTMAYVLAVVTQFNQGLPEIHIRARGKSITKAVDISQIVKHRFVSSLQIKHVELGTEELTSEEGRNTKVSSIDIVVTK